jgi:type I restriction enzyme R subunit
MSAKEAKARIKINKLLEAAGWRLLDSELGKANVILESTTKLDHLGDDFEKAPNGFIDFLLIDDYGKPIAVLEAKRESINPLFGKEQARSYANSQKARYVILSNGDIHYFWDTEYGNPYQIYKFPPLHEIQEQKKHSPDPTKLVNAIIERDYVVETQLSDYKNQPEYADELKRDDLIKNQGLRFLRYYQIDAVKAVQKAVADGKTRFLLEMATGTGKTLTAAAIIKLFHKTGNARKTLFLVDRLELEEQARKDFVQYLKNDLTTLVYKEKKEEWHTADIVVTTIQSLMFNNKYKTLFQPTGFDLVISDESHRLLGGGNTRALFEHFAGYKLGLTATPKDYLKNLEQSDLNDPREMERRVLLDTYSTFGCESGTPTFRYTLSQGATDKYLVQPTVIDARTDVTARLLSEQGYSALVTVSTSEAEDILDEVNYRQSHFEKKFFSEKTNRVFVKAFVDAALRDPISGEIGKSLVFAVSQNHAAKLTQYLNEYIELLYPGKYNSDFAIQVTSRIKDSQNMTIMFRNDNLNGHSQWAKGDEILDDYKTSKARVCVTVGMMTTGWDCPNILNLAMMRPIFSPTEFIQIKGRGTRTNTFEHKYKNDLGEIEVISADKKTFKLFDFFANYDFFEKEYNYDQVLILPALGTEDVDIQGIDQQPKASRGIYEYADEDNILTVNEQQIDHAGMRVDRMFYQQFEQKMKEDGDIAELMEQGSVDSAIGIAQEKYLDKPDEFFTIDKLRKALKIDRKISMRELLEQIFFGYAIKMKDELLDDEFSKFIASVDISQVRDISALRYYFYAYITDPEVRRVIDQHEYTDLYFNSTLSIVDYDRVDESMKNMVPDYIKTYIPIARFDGTA